MPSLGLFYFGNALECPYDFKTNSQLMCEVALGCASGRGKAY